jgi:hypothetical protein
MKQYTIIKAIRFSEMQSKSLDILESKGVNVSQFIRLAIKEKINRDWNHIKQPKIKQECPF